MIGDKFMQRRHPVNPLRHPACGQLGTGLVAHVHTVMSLSPIISNKDHARGSPSLGSVDYEPERHQRGLMDQCSRHDTPPVLRQPSPTNRGTL